MEHRRQEVLRQPQRGACQMTASAHEGAPSCAAPTTMRPSRLLRRRAQAFSFLASETGRELDEVNLSERRSTLLVAPAGMCQRTQKRSVLASRVGRRFGEKSDEALVRASVVARLERRDPHGERIDHRLRFVRRDTARAGMIHRWWTAEPRRRGDRSAAVGDGLVCLLRRSRPRLTRVKQPFGVRLQAERNESFGNSDADGAILGKVDQEPGAMYFDLTIGKQQKEALLCREVMNLKRGTAGR